MSKYKSYGEYTLATNSRGGNKIKGGHIAPLGGPLPPCPPISVAPATELYYVLRT